MKSPRRIHFWGFLALLAFGAGWWPLGTAQPPSLMESAPQTDRAAAEGSALNAPPAKWATVWEAATAAERRLLLESWKARDPGALYHFLRSLPPLSVPAQHVLEYQALLAWAERDPEAAYPVACAGNDEYLRPADHILDHWLNKDLDRAMDLVILPTAQRSSMGTGALACIAADPARVCKRLAGAAHGLARDAFFRISAQVWAAKDPAAALAFARTLPGVIAGEMMAGMIASLPLQDAAALVLQRGKSGPTESDTWPLMVRWGREDAVAAVTWASENLSPSAFADALRCLDSVAIFREDAADTAPAIAAALPPAAWNILARPDFNSSGGLPVLTPYAPDWVLPRLAEKLRFSAIDLTASDTTPRWFSALSPERAELVVRQHFARNPWPFGPAAMPGIASVPERWQQAAAEGVISALTALPGEIPPWSVERALGELTPATRAVYLAELEHLQGPPERLAEIRKALAGPPDATAPGPQ